MERGFAINFDQLGQFLSSQGLHLNMVNLIELRNRYVGNNAELQSKPVMLSFTEL